MELMWGKTLTKYEWNMISGGGNVIAKHIYENTGIEIALITYKEVFCLIRVPLQLIIVHQSWMEWESATGCIEGVVDICHPCMWCLMSMALIEMNYEV